ncbi:MAG TPA: deoxyribonuclease IV, partial [Thermoanaerobaculia bacterium]|nr:deoxyribonuclease IV [Thermoanaerobaculia bacterium]
MLLGVHASVAGGLANAYTRGVELACGAIQIFVKNANQWRGKELLETEVATFRGARAGSGIGPLLAHASYLINLSATDPVVLARSREALADELTRCARLGVDGLVLHPGAHLGAGVETGIERVAESLDRVLGELPDGPTRVLLENTAGQGTCLGHRLEHLEDIRAQVAAPDRVGVCVDTCHAFAAGYAIHEASGYGEFVAELDERIGLERVGGFHVNDSVRPFASRRDRHAHIGEGEIGLALFERLLNDPRLRQIPMVVETDPEEEM